MPNPNPEPPTLDLDGFEEICEAGAEKAGDNTVKIPEIGTTRHERAVERERFARIDRETSAVAAIKRIPRKGREVLLLMTGSFHGFDLIAAVLELARTSRDDKPVIKELVIATLGFNRAQADRLAEMIDAGEVLSLTMLVSHMFAAKDTEEYGYIADQIRSRGQTIGATRNHAKLILMHLDDGRRIVIHGSLNLRRCHAFEQVSVSNDPGAHEFFRQFVRDAMAGTIEA